MARDEDWKRYQEVACRVVADLRTEIGVSEVEGEQPLPGTSGTSWRVDGKAVLVGDEGFLVIEARQHTTKGQSQESVAAFAYRIRDVGATGGVVVSPLPLQKGAEIIAAHEGVQHVQLEAWSTTENYLARFLGKAFYRISLQSKAVAYERLSATVTKADGSPVGDT